mmetsp:Transcript_16557/g.38338  ORF Transcript_16557/g.38338 Transcript_16557/m.38338 type:complete len:211 (+) Transcript_16557:181-813(+)
MAVLCILAESKKTMQGAISPRAELLAELFQAPTLPLPAGPEVRRPGELEPASPPPDVLAASSWSLLCRPPPSRLGAPCCRWAFSWGARCAARSAALSLAASSGPPGVASPSSSAMRTAAHSWAPPVGAVSGAARLAPSRPGASSASAAVASASVGANIASTVASTLTSTVNSKVASTVTPEQGKASEAASGVVAAEAARGIWVGAGAFAA